MGTQTIFSASWETCVQATKQQLEPWMEQRTGSRSSKEYDRLSAVTLFV